MIKVLQTLDFQSWIDGIHDSVTKFRLLRRLERFQRGSFGDIKQIGGDIFEMREFFGPGWRLYYLKKEKAIIVMLGGTKSTQDKDIAKVKKIAQVLRD